MLEAGLEWRSKTTPSLHQSEGSSWASVSTLVPLYLGLQVQTSAAGCLVVHAAEELIPSQWREHQMACGRASSEANGWHQPASELLLRGNLLNIVCCTLGHHIVSSVEDQRGSLVVAQHQLALELYKAICLSLEYG